MQTVAQSILIFSTGIHWIGSRVDPRGGHNMVVKKIILLLQGIEPKLLSP
jgi:hypothetical protein